MKKITSVLMITLSLLATSASAEPVTLINVFEVPAGKETEAVKFWENAASFMKKQPGYISTALHQSVQTDAKFHLINIAKWESIDAYKTASSARKAQAGSKPPEGLIPSPALYTVIRAD